VPWPCWLFVDCTLLGYLFLLSRPSFSRSSFIWLLLIYVLVYDVFFTLLACFFSIVIPGLPSLPFGLNFTNMRSTLPCVLHADLIDYFHSNTFLPLPLPLHFYLILANIRSSLRIRTFTFFIEAPTSCRILKKKIGVFVSSSFPVS
jgi:hypothetical protein